MSEEEIIRIATDTYNTLGTQFNVAKVPAHLHNGVDTNNLPIQSIAGYFAQVTGVPTITPTQFSQCFATDTATGVVYYYDFNNKKWRTTSGHRVFNSIVSGSSTTINTDLYNALSITGLAEAITISTSGTPSNFDSLIIRIKDNGGAQTLNWNASNFSAEGVALPTTTVISKLLTVGFLYNSVTSRWGCQAVNNQP